ncbi:hypothetical protein KIPB_004828 [Kipferlia bialata]|uniref:Aminotransferase class V domain-containing protein n=1 Tax=Kipferlia bialata TaxID=797122 RepID=A0A9K3CXJ1_9EUKA|nr:hypothetical protein KIPB_004828 [Kipferlia bialata]|eukprot:g4828.t1
MSLWARVRGSRRDSSRPSIEWAATQSAAGPRDEFQHLKDETYLDYTGSALYQRGQLREMFTQLEGNLFCNAHSDSSCSMRTEAEVTSVRRTIMDWFNCGDDYTVIFTAGTTASLKMVGETFPWSEHSLYGYSRHNHNSVLGMRELAMAKGSSFLAAEWDLQDPEYIQQFMPKESEEESSEEPVEQFNPEETPAPLNDETEEAFHLFAFPAECNFSGIKYPLDLVHALKRGTLGEHLLSRAVETSAMPPGYKNRTNTWRVCVDAAAYAPTNPLDLQAFPADFVTMSFYKLFGIPTGLGALLVRKDVAPFMNKTFFGGGTVVAVSCDSSFCKLRPISNERFEDGTISFLDIIGLSAGFNVFKSLGKQAITDHVWTLTRYLYLRVSALKHKNGRPLLEIYGNHEHGDPKRQGGILSFNVLSPKGQYVPFKIVMEAAKASNLLLRAGAHCNPGAAFGYLTIEEEDVQTILQERESCHAGDGMWEGKPLGSCRASLGYPTTVTDVDSLTTFLKATYTDRDMPKDM